MKLIKRETYLNKLINVIGTPDIKVITGIRRSGKSKLLEAFKKYIDEKIQNANIIHINYNISKFEEFMEYHKLYDYICQHYEKNKKNFVLIDEIQMCDGFEKVINWIHAEEKYDVYITGSNAFLLSSDLATLFTGRTFEIEVYPFSFKEFQLYYHYSNKYEAFNDYLLNGGMSGSYLYKEQKEKYQYIHDVYNTLILRDIKNKYKIRNEKVLNNLGNYLMDNISNLTSSNKITKTINSNKDKITDKTVSKYIEYLCHTFAFYKVGRYDIKGKKYLSSLDKYYLSDHSFKFAILGKKNMDYGRVLENIVAIELLRRGYEIYVGTLYQKEIDFVAMKNNEQIYIQVCENLNDEKTLNREISPLLSIKDGYKKMIITRLNHEGYLQDGIEVIDIADWLSQ